MRRRAQRLLTEDRVVRALSGGGMARLSADGGWRVFRSRDARGRAIGRALDHVMERLLQAGQVRRHARSSAADDAPQRLVWAAGAQRAGAQDVALPPPPAVPGAGPRAGKRALLTRALTKAGDRGTKIRLAAAAGRYAADIEQAATPQPITMRWDAAPVQGGRADGGAFGPGGRAMAASARLDAVSAAVGEMNMRVLDETLVRGASAAGLGRLLGCDAAGAVEAAYGALTALAQAYDLAVRGV